MPSGYMVAVVSLEGHTPERSLSSRDFQGIVWRQEKIGFLVYLQAMKQILPQCKQTCLETEVCHRVVWVEALAG